MQNLIIKPSRELRNNYAELSKLCKNNYSIAVTVNGAQDTMLVNFNDQMKLLEDYEKVKARLRLYDDLARSQDDIRMGRIFDSENVFDEVLEKIERFE